MCGLLSPRGKELNMKTNPDLAKAYIRKFSEVSGFKVWIVNGTYIRTNVDEEFTNYGQHYRFRFIPEDELWIDQEMNPGEEKYFIDSMLVMNRLMAKGMRHDEAVKIADRLERRERSKSKLMRKEMRIKETKGDVLKTVYKEPIKDYSSDKIKLWIVNGELVRDLFFLDFTEGGHHLVYKFIPKEEVWIDDDLPVNERGYVILHELHERNLMSLGNDYPSAHKASSEIEYFCRKHPESLEIHIKKELDKSQ